MCQALVTRFMNENSIEFHIAANDYFGTLATTLDLSRQAIEDETRQKVMMSWYRQYLKATIPPLLEKWQRRLGVRVSACGIKKMKTKWGTCNAEASRIWINLELAKKSVDCLEYVVLHELVHLLVRRHDDQFVEIMDKCLPRWRILRAELNGLPLAHELWRE